MKQDNTDNRQAAEAQQLRKKSAFINQVASFAEYMQKEYIEPSDGERSLIISAGDATTDDDCVLRTQCLMGQHVQVSAGLASMMSDADWRPVFRLARRMADDYDDLDDRRSKLRRDRRRLLTVIAISTFWAVWLVTLLIIDIVMHRSVLIDITCLLLMAGVALNLYPSGATCSENAAAFVPTKPTTAAVVSTARWRRSCTASASSPVSAMMMMNNEIKED